MDVAEPFRKIIHGKQSILALTKRYSKLKWAVSTSIATAMLVSGLFVAQKLFFSSLNYLLSLVVERKLFSQRYVHH